MFYFTITKSYAQKYRVINHNKKLHENYVKFSYSQKLYRHNFVLSMIRSYTNVINLKIM